MKTKGIEILTLIILLVIPVTLCAWGFLLPACFSETFMGELPAKAVLLDETEGPRIVVVGGSAAAFAIDSDYIAQEMDPYHVVNFGMYAGLGTRAMLSISRSGIRKGDLVIVMPEQQEQSLTDYFGAEYFWQAADDNFRLLTRLSRKEMPEVIGAFPAFAADKFRYVTSGQMPEPDEVYRKTSFADNGDIRKGIAVENCMPGGYDVNTPIRFEEKMVSGEFADLLNAYTEETKMRGAAVFYHFSPMNVKACMFEEGGDADRQITSYTETLAGRLTCPVLGDPRDSILDAEYFFDTNFHLTDAGREFFTRQLIRDLKAELGDASKTGIMGEERENAMASEDRKDESENHGSENSEFENSRDTSVITGENEGFLYERKDESVTLTGLTESGKQEKVLVVPPEIDGIPVEMISASAFAGQTQAERIEIPSSVRMIEDYAFDGCISLHEIVMEGSEPEKCIVGRHLLDGTHANIIVSSEVLSAYRLNYNWSVWSGRIVADLK